MPMIRPALVVAAFSLALPVIAAEAAVQEFQCQRGDLIRRVQLQFADDADRLPCEVIYWRDSEAPGQPQRLWNAKNEIGFCTEKAREMVARLESAGWACDGVANASAGADRTAAPAVPERSSRDPGNSEDPPSSQGSEPATAAGRPDQATLQAALARDMRRLDELTVDSSGTFETETATLGDLNGDGVKDAAVLLTHRAEGTEPTHYLLAYLFDGQTFQPVARINLEAYYQNFSDVGIQAVTDGAVELLLQVPRADDPACCPSGSRRATFGLQDRHFVLLKESGPGA